jgi:hypothetical protein
LLLIRYPVFKALPGGIFIGSGLLCQLQAGIPGFFKLLKPVSECGIGQQRFLNL